MILNVPISPQAHNASIFNETIFWFYDERAEGRAAEHSHGEHISFLDSECDPICTSVQQREIMNLAVKLLNCGEDTYIDNGRAYARLDIPDEWIAKEGEIK